MLERKFAFNYLDSGVLYRVLAYEAERNEHVDLQDEEALVAVARHLPVKFVSSAPGEMVRILLIDQDVTEAIRSEHIGHLASQISSYPKVRTALLQRQRDFARPPGLITDGRDMGTVVFPEADLKFYLDADVAIRAKRRQKQLQKLGINVSLDHLLATIQGRDDRDKHRAVSPLKPADDAVIIDTSTLSVDEVFAEILAVINKRLPELSR